MLFSSNVFILLFLPVVLFAYYILLRRSRRCQNIFLCVASLFFYAWGEPYFVVIMLVSIFVNWEMGLQVEEHRHSRYAGLILAADIVFNIAVIFVFKYLAFFIEAINSVFKSGIQVPEIALPIGISFFTFQAISYVADIYRERAEAQKNIVDVGLYISFFPQLIAGPIVRYEAVAYQISHRKENFSDFSYGVTRFIIGLGKKVIIANNLAVVADKAFELVLYQEGGIYGLSAGMAWLGAVAYTLQIFFDFSGYSDMAAGLGRMFGFRFPENFNYPYISRTAAEFWRRWHISLGSWFRDYVYIPLGGSRVNRSRHIFNLFIVWLCTGLWHGADWTFVLWGMMYLVLQIFEKATGIDRDSGRKIIEILKRIYLLFFVIIGWVLFRADNIQMAADYYRCMFGMGPVCDNGFAVFYMREYGVFFALGMLFSSPVAHSLAGKIDRKGHVIPAVVYGCALMAMFLISMSYIVKGSYNPFIYFNF